ncbi:VP4 [Liao ning virus]|uniref:VP4 n=1 Tax=Liao ning virus TaxID=246280 RepID=Q2TV16_9REOV|nr:VP4 [Liao ning virus]
MSVFDYSLQTKVLDFGLTGMDNYAPDSSLASALKPRPLISNEREHANVIRIDRIEHDLVKDRMQEEADRNILKDDIAMFATSLKTIVDFDNHTEFVLNNLNSSITKAEQSRVKDENFLLAAINENVEAVNDIIANQQALTAAEKADLIMEQVINSSRAVAHTSAAIADGVGVIPIFGPNVASGAKVLADTAEAVADTTAAIKASQISQQLSTAFSALRTVHEHPNKFIEAAVNTIRTGEDLVPKLKQIVDRSRRANELTFSRVTVPGSISHSHAYVSVLDDYDVLMVYHIKPSTGAYGIKASIGSRRVSYSLHGLFGELDSFGFGPEIMASGIVALPPIGSRQVEFNTVINADRCRAMLMALQSPGLSLSDEEYVGYFEQYLCRAIEPTNRTVLSALHSSFDSIHSDSMSNDMHFDHVAMLGHLDTHRQKHKDNLEAKLPGSSDILVPLGHVNRAHSTHTLALKSTFRIGDFRVYDYFIGPFTHSGKFVIGVVIDSMYVGSYTDNRRFIYSQYSGHEGQRINSVANSSEAPIRLELTLTVKSDLTIEGVEGDRAVFRVYGVDLHSVRVITGLSEGSDAVIQPPMTTSDHKALGFDYGFMRRHIDPKIVNNTADLGYHEWEQYHGNGNWTNIKPSEA